MKVAVFPILVIKYTLDLKRTPSDLFTYGKLNQYLEKRKQITIIGYPIEFFPTYNI